MVGALCNLENIPKHCLKQIGTERTPQLRMQELKRASLLDLLFRTSGCFIRPSFVELSGEIIYELEQRLSVQLKSRCSLSREQLMLSAVWIDFRLNMRGLKIYSLLTRLRGVMCLQFVKNDNNGISQTEVAYGESTYYKKKRQSIYKAARAILAF